MGHDAAPLCARGRAVVRGAAGSALEHRGAARLRRRGDVRGAHVAGHPNHGARSTTRERCPRRTPCFWRVYTAWPTIRTRPIYCGSGIFICWRPASRIRNARSSSALPRPDRCAACAPGGSSWRSHDSRPPRRLGSSRLSGRWRVRRRNFRRASWAVGCARSTRSAIDLSLVGGWRARLAVIGAHLFPSRRYMRSMYPGWPTAALPLTYLDRIVRGAPKWFRRPGD